jgi:hypothetical protein
MHENSPILKSRQSFEKLLKGRIETFPARQNSRTAWYE